MAKKRTKKPAPRSAKKFSLSRRFFLGGAGCAVALPYLEAMMPSGRRARAAGDHPVRTMYVHVPNGMIRDGMTPSSAGAGYAMTPMVAPIERHRANFSILSGISNRPGQGTYRYPDHHPTLGGTTSSDGPGDHARDTGTFLTAARLVKTSNDADIRNGISVDQRTAQHTSAFTAIPSLVLATRTGSYGGDSGYAPVYKSNISWISATQPASKETSPRAIFERIFRGFDAGETLAERERRLALEGSVLDSVVQDIARLEGRLGSSDREKLDQYLTGIRALEEQLAMSEGAGSCDPGGVPVDDSDFPAYVELMFDVVALAFQCDRTRVVSLDMEKSGNVYDFLRVGGSAISSAHHNMSHLEAGSTDINRIKAINEWQIEMFGRLLDKLQDRVNGDGTNLLDSTLVMFGGGLDGTGHGSGDTMGDLTPRTSGPVHRHTNLPLFLGGRGCGAHTPGRHIVYDDEPIANLYIRMMQAAGVMEDGAPISRFAIEGTRPIDQLA